MSNVTAKHPPRIPSFYDPAQFRVSERDREIFARELVDFVPPSSFDAHAHWYDMRVFAPGAPQEVFERPTWVGHAVYSSCLEGWMGDRSPKRGLYFPMPARGLDVQAANSRILDEIRDYPDSRCLLIIRPDLSASHVESQLRDKSIVGFKVYHLFADRSETFNATPSEYIPTWAWELADQHGLCIMLHLVMQRSLADSANQRYIVEHCRRYPNARLILAHAARGFCGRHTVEGIASLRGLQNVYFDTSVICEAEAFQAILETFGVTRLMFGTDFPVSEARGRAVTLGDGFHWLYEHELPPAAAERATLVGIESLLALRQACRVLRLNDSDVERVFQTNAMDLFGLRSLPAQEQGTGQQLYLKVKQVVPGGTQLVSKRPEQYAPGQWPAYYRETRGCEVIDLDGRRYLDFATSGIGCCLLGYAHPAVTAAVIRRVHLGSMSTLNSPEEFELANLLLGMHPWARRIRLARCGGEALAVAIRIARAGTRRDVIAFCGYHGWSDWYLAANLADANALAGHLLSGLSPAGVPQVLRGTTLPFTYNRIDELQKIIREHGAKLAAVIMEPTRSVEPTAGFLQDIRQLCDDAGARLIFDEVTTGFRLHRGGVHLKLGVQPDIAVFAKALGNGHPIAAVIGTSDAMDAAQDSFISSTYWTEGVGPAAAVATLQEFLRVDVPTHVQRVGTRVREGLSSLATSAGVPLRLSGYPALTFMAIDHPQADALMTLFTVRMLSSGFLCGTAFYPTLAHDDHTVQLYLRAADSALAEVSAAIKRNDVLDRIGGKVRHSGFRRLN